STMPKSKITARRANPPPGDRPCIVEMDASQYCARGAGLQLTASCPRWQIDALFISDELEYGRERTGSGASAARPGRAANSRPDGLKPDAVRFRVSTGFARGAH